MNKIFICEDDNIQLLELKKYIENYICIQNYDMCIKLATTNPEEIIKYLEKNKTKMGVYFLDIHLNHALNGLKLAEIIKTMDDAAKIILVTSDNNLAYMTFKYKLEILDYIKKSNLDEVKQRIKDCIDTLMFRMLHNKKEEFFSCKEGENIKNIEVSRIMYFETSIKPHRIIIHLLNDTMEIYGSITEIVNQYDMFIRCHESIAVNKEKIRQIDKSKRQITLKNGETITGSLRLMKNIYKLYD